MSEPGAAVARLAPTHPIEVLREQIAPDATDAELVHFANVCSRLDLSPFADQIVLIGRYDKRVRRNVHRHQITVAGRRTLAVRTGRLAGIEGPVWCGPRTETGALVWRDVWDEDEPPYCARVLVHVHGWDVPANGTAKWSEFAQYDSGGRLIPTWQAMPSHMLGKVAESMALRRAFPDVIDPAVSDEFPFPVDVEIEDHAETDEALAAPPTFPQRVTSGAASGTAAPAAGHVQMARTGERLPADWQPSIADQAAAHRTIGGLGEGERTTFCHVWDIEDFGELWSAGAVADALGLEMGGPTS